MRGKALWASTLICTSSWITFNWPPTNQAVTEQAKLLLSEKNSSLVCVALHLQRILTFDGFPCLWLLPMMVEKIPGCLIRSGPPSMCGLTFAVYWWGRTGKRIPRLLVVLYGQRWPEFTSLQPARHVFVWIQKYICPNCKVYFSTL